MLVMYNEYYGIFICRYERENILLEDAGRTVLWERMGKELKKAAAVAGTCAYAGGNGGEIRGADEESNRWDLKIRPR